MTFETADGVAAWKAARVSHDQWSDWTDWFETPLAPTFVVEKQLSELRKLHDPKRTGYFVIDEQGPTVDFAFDTGEDTVRDFSGTIAAALRASESHGARGTFYFLGTAGAEYDFTYKLEIANGHSTMESLTEREIATIYEGDEYQAFLQRVMEALGITAEGDLDDANRIPSDLADVLQPSTDPEREALKQKAAAFTATRADQQPENAAPNSPTTRANTVVPKAAQKAAPKKAQKAAPKKAPPKKAAQKAAPKKAQKAAPKKAVQKAAPKKAAQKAAPKKTTPKKAAPKKAAPTKAAQKNQPQRSPRPRKQSRRSAEQRGIRMVAPRLAR